MAAEPGSSSTTEPPKRPFDNFYSPQNVQFYESLPYKPLDPLKKQIRLLYLHPGEPDEPLVCDILQPVSVDGDDVSYLAISYCAGDPKVTMSVTVDGRAFNAFHSLGTALRKIRDTEEVIKQNGGRRTLFWADQICIDQSSPLERSQQVGLMRNIYEGANQVMIWLGGEGKSGSGIRWLERMYWRLRQPAVEAPGDPIELEGKPVALETKRVDVVSDLARSFIENYEADPVVTTEWKGLIEVLASPWWHRCWVIQELVVSRDAVVLFADARISWDKLSAAHSVFAKIIIELDYMLQADEKAVIPGKMHVKEFAGTSFGLLNYMVTSKNRWRLLKGTPMKLVPLLIHSLSAQSFDPRDHVYSFLSLTEPGYAIVPDYNASNTVNDTLIHTAKRIILNDGDLIMLSFASMDDQADDSELPSWVPNWCADSFSALVLKPGDYNASRGWLASPLFPTDSEGRKDRILRVGGAVIDEIASDYMQEKPVDEAVSEFISTLKADTSGDSDKGLGGLYFTGELTIRAVLSTAHLGKGDATTEFPSHGRFEEVVNAAAKTANSVSASDYYYIRSLRGRQRFFVSPKGYIGLADFRCRPSDVIVILLGARSPFVMRKVGEAFRLIGPAYVHGLMDGEFRRLVMDRKLELQNLDII